MKKETENMCMPECEDCTQDAPTNYEEAYKALKAKYEQLEQGLDHAHHIIKQKDKYIEYLNDELAHNSLSANIVLKTVKTLKNNIEVLDNTLDYTTRLESELNRVKRTLDNKSNNEGDYYE